MNYTLKSLTLLLPLFCLSSCKERPSPPQLSTRSVTDILYTTATAGGSVTDDGGAAVVSRGVCWSNSPEPDLTDYKTLETGTTGDFTSYLEQLDPNTTYYVRAYATNSEGTAFGNQVVFWTLQTESPELTTAVVTNISRRTAVSGGVVTDENGSPVTARGVCWSKTSNPVISDNKTTDGAGTGSFTSSVTGLKGGVTYYLRAYATNSVGTAYGNEVRFTTAAPDLPSVITKEISSVLTTSVICGGTIASDGEGEITQQGLCFSTNPNPSISDNVYSDLSKAGDFTCNVSGINRNTTYYIRAFAKNAAGITYGDERIFKTFGVIDASGNKYYSVVYGAREWMQTNLRTTRYANGDPIPSTNPYDLDLAFVTAPKYQWPCEGDDSKVEVYGRFYSWFTVIDPRNLCPTGWHVSTDDDWTILENYLVAHGYNYDGTLSGNKIGKSMAVPTGWIHESTPGAIGNNGYPEYHNKSGFSAYPAGCRLLQGLFTEFGWVTYWWTSTEFDDVSAWIRELVYSGVSLNRGDILKLEQSLPVRCVMNTQ